MPATERACTSYGSANSPTASARTDVAAEALRQRIEDGPFEHLDARLL